MFVLQYIYRSAQHSTFQFLFWNVSRFVKTTGRLQESHQKMLAYRYKKKENLSLEWKEVC